MNEDINEEDKMIFECYHSLLSNIVIKGAELSTKIPTVKIVSFYSTLATQVLSMVISLTMKGTVVNKDIHELINLISNNAIEKAIELAQEEGDV
jgi:hypothetical protein